MELKATSRERTKGEIHSPKLESICARLIDPANEHDVCAYQKLRYDWFVHRKAWVPADPKSPGRETDRYDAFCHHFGVFQGLHLAAYIRALPWHPVPGLMLQHEFRELLDDEAANNIGCVGNVELSRLIVSPSPGSPRSEMVKLAELLFKEVYREGKCLGWTGHYIVLEEAWLRLLNRRFHLPFAPIGVPQMYPDGTRALAAYADCEALEEAMFNTAPDKYHWYRQDVENL